MACLLPAVFSVVARRSSAAWRLPAGKVVYQSV